jgi:hypothetical protein
VQLRQEARRSCRSAAAAEPAEGRQPRGCSRKVHALAVLDAAAAEARIPVRAAALPEHTLLEQRRSLRRAVVRTRPEWRAALRSRTTAERCRRCMLAQLGQLGHSLARLVSAQHMPAPQERTANAAVEAALVKHTPEHVPAARRAEQGACTSKGAPRCAPSLVPFSKVFQQRAQMRS